MPKLSSLTLTRIVLLLKRKIVLDLDVDDCKIGLMNSYEAKKLNLPEIMSRMGYEPTSIKKNGNEYWYNSPFRPENEASFHTSYLGGKWIWNDFGDSGGTVIDFILRHENFSTVSQALSFLDDLYGKVGDRIKSSSFQKQKINSIASEHVRELEFISSGPIQNSVILSYLTEQRGIDKEIALKYLEEVKYKNLNNDREYFAFGIQNLSGGFEVRVASDKYPFKSALIKKDVSLVSGFKSQKVVNVFEGMTDYLSLLTLLKSHRLPGDAILMHSLSLIERTSELIKEKDYNSIHLYLDNNKPGRLAAQNLKDQFGEMVSDESHLFLPFVDINDMLKSQFDSPLRQQSLIR